MVQLAPDGAMIGWDVRVGERHEEAGQFVPTASLKVRNPFDETWTLGEGLSVEVGREAEVDAPPQSSQAGPKRPWPTSPEPISAGGDVVLRRRARGVVPAPGTCAPQRTRCGARPGRTSGDAATSALAPWSRMPIVSRLATYRAARAVRTQADDAEVVRPRSGAKTSTGGSRTG